MSSLRSLLSVVVFSSIVAHGAASAAPVMVVGIDTKFWIDDTGGRVFQPDSGDLLQVYDLSDPAHPQLICELPLPNSVVGPPTNLAVTPDGKLALTANALLVAGEGASKPTPDNRVFVVDLAARPSRILDTIQVGAQPSGIAISRDGTTALVANRAGKSVSVLSITGTKVEVTDTIAMDEAVTSAAFTPDGKHALISEYSAHRVAGSISSRAR